MADILDNCYIYIHHTKTYLKLPVIPDSVIDSMTSTFTPTNALSRSAPVYSYSNSGPRTIDFNLNFHRDMFNEANYGGLSNAKLDYDEDYFDYFKNNLQAMSLPNYDASNKAVIPPTVSIRLGNEIFITGVISGNVSVTYNPPFGKDGKYKVISIGFPVTEVEPYDADTVAQLGSFRGLTRAFRKTTYSQESTSGLIDNSTNARIHRI